MALAARGMGVGLVLLLLLLAALWMLLVPAVAQQQTMMNAVAAIPAVPKTHAVERHGETALEIRRCLRDKGAMQIWQLNNGRFAQVCQLDDGRLGIQIVEKVKGVWEEVTAFTPYDGSYEKVLKYLARKGILWEGALP